MTAVSKPKSRPPRAPVSALRTSSHKARLCPFAMFHLPKKLFQRRTAMSATTLRSGCRERRKRTLSKFWHVRIQGGELSSMRPVSLKVPAVLRVSRGRRLRLSVSVVLHFAQRDPGVLRSGEWRDDSNGAQQPAGQRPEMPSADDLRSHHEKHREDLQTSISFTQPRRAEVAKNVCDVQQRRDEQDAEIAAEDEH